MAETNSSILSPLQRRLAGFALSLVAFVGIIAVFVLVIAVLGRLLGLFSHVIWPLAVAGILALILRPLVSVIERWFKLSRVFSVLVLYALVAAVLLSLTLIFGPKFFREFVDLVDNAPDLWTRAKKAFYDVYPQWSESYDSAMKNETLRGIIQGTLDQLQAVLPSMLPNFKTAGGTVLGAFSFITSLALVPVFLFFFLQSDEDPTKALHAFLPFLKDSTREDVVFLAREFLSIVVAFFRGQLVIGLIMGVLLAIGFWAVGVEFGFVFGLFAGFLNAIPYLGTILGLSAVLPTAYFQTGGGFAMVSLCLGVFVLVQCIEAYFLTPRIMGRQTGLHPAVIIIAILFWGTALHGILGMVLAIPFTAFFVTVWRLAKRKYIRQVV